MASPAMRVQFQDLDDDPPVTGSSAPTGSDAERVKIFLGMQVFFLAITPFTGGFHFAIWSMTDTALMIQAIGITALVVVLDREWMRIPTLRLAILFTSGVSWLWALPCSLGRRRVERCDLVLEKLILKNTPCGRCPGRPCR